MYDVQKLATCRAQYFLYEILTGKQEHSETLAVTMTAKMLSSSRQQFLCPRLPLLTPPHPYSVLLSVRQRPELETQLGQIFTGKLNIKVIDASSFPN